MKKKSWVLTLFFSVVLFSHAYSSSPTYKKLVKSRCTDHVQHFEKLFSHQKIHHFLEYGLGDGTKYFLEQCDQVTSVELLVHEGNVKWLKKCRNLYEDLPNWEVDVVDIRKQPTFCSALSLVEKKINPLLIDDYCASVDELVQNSLVGRDVDLAFVDCGFTPRADIVNALFGRVKIIAAHDTNPKNACSAKYGWVRIKPPESYETIHFSKGQGVTFWIHKDFADLIKALKTGS